MRESLGIRCSMLEEISAGRVSISTGAERLGLSDRQMRRLLKRYSAEGSLGIEHRGKGRRSNRSYGGTFKEQVLQIYVESCLGMGPTEFCKALTARGIAVDHETLRRWLIARGLWQGQQEKGGRKGDAATMLGFGRCLALLSAQVAWLGPDEPCSWLHVLRDDDTGTFLASLDGLNDCAAPMRLLWAWVERHGIPLSLCCRKRLMIDEGRRLTFEEEFMGIEPRTPFSQACEKLGIGVLPLNQARGSHLLRRMAGQLDALKSRIAAHGPHSVEEADALLRGIAIDGLNGGENGAPAGRDDFHVPILDGTDLRNLFYVRDEYEVCLGGRGGEEGGRHLLLSRADRGQDRRRKVTVVKWLDGSVHCLCNGRELSPMSLDPELKARLAM